MLVFLEGDLKFKATSNYSKILSKKKEKERIFRVPLTPLIYRLDLPVANYLLLLRIQEE